MNSPQNDRKPHGQEKDCTFYPLTARRQKDFLRTVLREQDRRPSLKRLFSIFLAAQKEGPRRGP